MKVFFYSALLAMTMFCLSAAMPSPIALGFAEPYAIVAGSTVTSSGVTGTIVVGNLALHPGTVVTGFPPALLYGAQEVANTAAVNAQGSLTTAYNRAASLVADTSLSSMDLGGMTLLPGVYKFGGVAAVNGILTLDASGNPNAVWVFQIESSLMVAEGSSIIFKDGVGNADYVYWQVGSSATVGEKVPMIGNIMAYASITLNVGASITGRCLARHAGVTLDKNVISNPMAGSFQFSSASSDSSSSGLTEADKTGITVGVVLGFSVLFLAALWWFGCFSAPTSVVRTPVPATQV